MLRCQDADIHTGHISPDIPALLGQWLLMIGDPVTCGSNPGGCIWATDGEDPQVQHSSVPRIVGTTTSIYVDIVSL